MTLTLEAPERLQNTDVKMRVLVAVDGTEQSIRACRLLSHLLPKDARVTLLTVLSYGMYPFPYTVGQFSDEAARIAAVRRVVISRQAAARSILADEDIETVEKFRYGYPPEEILAEVDETNADLVVLGHRALSGATRWISSVSDRVTNKSGVPVLLVP